MRIRNRATAVRAIAQGRARRQGRARALSGAKIKSNSSNKATNKYATQVTGSDKSSSLSKMKQYYIYEELSKTTKGLQEHANALIKIGTETKTETKEEENKDKVLTAEEEKKIKEEKEKALQEEKDNVLAYVKKLVNSYNIISEDLIDSNSNTNKVFRNQLKTMVTNYEKKLEKIGITVDKQGYMSIDDKKMKQADISDLKNVFCDKKGLSYDLREKAKNISENVETSLRMMNRIYGSSLTYNKYASSGLYLDNIYGKYSAWG